MRGLTLLTRRAMLTVKHQSCRQLLCGLIHPSAPKPIFAAFVIGLICSFCQAVDPNIIALDDLSQEWPEEQEYAYYGNPWGLANGVAVSEKLADQTAVKHTVSAAAAYFGFQMVTCSKSGMVIIPRGLIKDSGYYRITLKGEYDVGVYNYGWGLFSGHFGAYRLGVGMGGQFVPVVDRPPTLSDFAFQVIWQFANEVLLVYGGSGAVKDVIDALLSATDVVRAAGAFTWENGPFEVHDTYFIDAQKDCEISLQSRAECAVDCIGLASHFLLLETITRFREIAIEGPLTDVPPRLEVRPTHLKQEVSFGQVSVGQAQSVSLTLHNVGGGILDGDVVLQQSGSVFGITGDSVFSLLSHSSAKISLYFAPNNVNTFAAKLLVTDNKGETIHQIHLCGAGIAPVIKDSTATNLSTYIARPGETITFQYEISSPFDTETDAWLGATIRHHENPDYWHSDALHDKPVRLAPGLSSHSREFTLRDDAPPGRYDVFWGIHSGSKVGTGSIWHILPRLDLLQIRGLIEAEAALDKSYYEPGEDADLTVFCKDHSGNPMDVDSVTYVVKAGDRIIQGPLLCSPSTEVGQYHASIYTQDLDRGLYTISTIIMKSGYHTTAATIVLNVGLQEVDLVVEPDSVYITASKGTNPTYALAILNGGWEETNVSVSKSGPLAEWILLPESQFTLGGGSSRSYSFAVNVPSSASGVHQGTLTFVAGGKSETVDVTLKVTSFSPGDYFDRICDGGTVDSGTTPQTEYSCTLNITQQDLEAWKNGFIFAGIYARAGEVQRRGMVQLFVNGQYVAEDDVERSGHVCEWLFWTADVLGTSNMFVLRAKPGDDVGVDFDAMEFRIKFYAGDPDIRTTKQVDKQTLYAGETATVNVTIENVGSNVGNVLYAPDDPRFSDSLPEGLDFVSGSLHGSIHEFLPAPEPGSKDEFQYVFRATDPGTYVLPVFSFPYERKPYDGVAEYESQSNSVIVRVLPPQPPELQVQIVGLEKEYNQGESMSGLSIHVSADGLVIAGATIVYATKCDGDEILSGYSTTNSSGQFVPDGLNAPVIPGEYSIQATATKEAYSEGSASVSFVVRDSTPPEVPVLMIPPDRLRSPQGNIIFDWSDSDDAYSELRGYHIQIDDDTSFDLPEYDEDGLEASTYQPTNTLPPGWYWWRVQVTDEVGNVSAWSSVYKFLVDTEPPVISVAPTEVTFRLASPEPDLIQGVSATDNVEGDVTPWVIVGGERPDLGRTGTYRVTYNVGDQAGNAAVEKQRMYYITEIGIVGDFCGEGSDQPDGYVDYWDLLYFAQRWYSSPSDNNWDPRCDLDKEDNYVDYWDLLVFAQQWHKGVKP